MRAITKLMLLSLGAGAVALWRSQQAREKASQAFDMAKDRFQDVSAALPIGGQGAQQTGSDQAQRSTPATTTMLSQTNPDAGESMSHDGGTTSTTAQDSSKDTTLASDEDSIAQPVFHGIGEHDHTSSRADIPADSQIEQSKATASELVESSHQPASGEVSESSEQTGAAFRPADDPDAGQLDADGADRTITDRIRTRLGQELDHAEWGHVNINTQALGAVYLRGYVTSDELRSRIEQIASETEGVESVVNELNVEEQREA